MAKNSNRSQLFTFKLKQKNKSIVSKTGLTWCSRFLLQFSFIFLSFPLILKITGNFLLLILQNSNPHPVNYQLTSREWPKNQGDRSNNCEVRFWILFQKALTDGKIKMYKKTHTCIIVKPNTFIFPFGIYMYIKK